MANYERGVYEPGDEVRVFDGAEDEDEDIEGSRLPLLIVLALLVLAMFGGVVYLAYTQGVARGRGETPVLTAAAGPEKVAPENPGGAQVPYQGFKIYEQPAPPDDQADATDTTTPAAPQAQAMTAPPPAKPVEKPAPVKAVEKPVEKPVVAMAPPPAAKPAPKVAAPPPAIATGAPRALSTPAAAAPAPAAAAPAAATGSYVLQIGAYKSQAEADAAWKTYQGKHAALLAGYGENVQQADLGAKGTWYRLRVAGFRDRQVASGVCDRLKADGGACFLGK